jgi:hypothetical protein
MNSVTIAGLVGAIVGALVVWFAPKSQLRYWQTTANSLDGLIVQSLVSVASPDYSVSSPFAAPVSVLSLGAKLNGKRFSTSSSDSSVLSDTSSRIVMIIFA